MVNDAVTDARAAERRLWLLHAPPAVRDGLAALLALDDRLGGIVATAREPLIGQMRLTWWRDALAALDTRPPPAEPLLVTLAANVVAQTGASALARMVDGWERQLTAGPDRPAVEAAGRERGSALFAAMAWLLGEDDPRVASGGAAWAVGRAAATLAEQDDRAPMVDRARTLLREALAQRWPRGLRPLAALAALALSDLEGGRPNTPSRAALLWRIRLTGR